MPGRPRPRETQPANNGAHKKTPLISRRAESDRANKSATERPAPPPAGSLKPRPRRSLQIQPGAAPDFTDRWPFATKRTLCLVPTLPTMSCGNNGLFWLVHIVKVGNGRITEVHALLWRSARLLTNERNGEIGAAGARIRPRIKKNVEGKGETITAESNNTRLQIPSIRFKDTNHARRVHESPGERRRRAPPEERLYDGGKTITVNR